MKQITALELSRVIVYKNHTKKEKLRKTISMKNTWQGCLAQLLEQNHELL